MTRLARHIKPYLPAILAAIGLLFLQANADLALPDYMSRIVNVGIQQGGVESAAPIAMRASTFDTLLLFLSADDAEAVKAIYHRVDPGTSEAADVVGIYPAVKDETIYVQNDLTADQLTVIEKTIAPAFLVSAGITRASSDPQAAAEMADQMGLSLSNLPQGADPSQVLPQLPLTARLQMIDQVESHFSAMGDVGIEQAAIRLIHAEYTALGMDEGLIRSSYIVTTGFWMLLITLGGAICTILVGYLSARVAAGIARDLRLAIFEKVERFSSAEFDTFSTASLITRSTNDIIQIQMVSVMLIRMVFYAPIIGVGGIIRAIGKASQMWWIIAAAVGVLSVLIIIIYNVAVPKFKIMQKLIDRLNLVSREMLSGIMVVRAFNMQDHEEDRFDKANRDLTATMLFVNRVMVVMMPVMMLIMNGLSILIIWIGAREVANASIQVGDMMAFIQYAMQIVMAFLMLSMMFIMLPRAAVSADRIAEVLETEPSIKDPDMPYTFQVAFVPSVEFRNVTFRYPAAEEDALHNISFTAEAGKTTAIVGATGAGKSTIANMVPRFYDVTGGAILVGGVDVRELNQHDLRERIGYVPQRATLFTGSIADNVRYGRENATDAEVHTATAVAQADEFIDERDEGIDSEIAQAGANLSGGQKQRISIARALAKQAPIYIFDDSFSVLDYRTDAKLRRALKSKTIQNTVLIISQRVSTIRGADRILVLDDGRIVGHGTHKELMDECETYREIALSQHSEEELV